jgi:hypothetical protein
MNGHSYLQATLEHVLALHQEWCWTQYSGVYERDSIFKLEQFF